jgi:hypothetical protein
MKKIIFILIPILILSCDTDDSYDNDKIIFIAYHDMFLGYQELKLMNDDKFKLSLATKETAGNYFIKGDTIYLRYNENHAGDNWPTKFLIDSKNRMIISLDQNIIPRLRL